MNEIVKLTMPTAKVEQIKALAKKRGYSSVSAYVNYLFDKDKSLISEKELLASSRRASREYKQGKSIRAQTILDLLDH